jgi:hypothetical protein
MYVEHNHSQCRCVSLTCCYVGEILVCIIYDAIKDDHQKFSSAIPIKTKGKQLFAVISIAHRGIE